jgi:branched-chain amino acid transport system permease protein
VVIGGIGSVTGSVLSAFLVTAAQGVVAALFRYAADHRDLRGAALRTGFRMVVFSVLLMVVWCCFNRRGLMGTTEFSWDFFWKKRNPSVKGGARDGR